MDNPTDPTHRSPDRAPRSWKFRSPSHPYCNRYPSLRAVFQSFPIWSPRPLTFPNLRIPLQKLSHLETHRRWSTILEVMNGHVHILSPSTSQKSSPALQKRPPRWSFCFRRASSRLASRLVQCVTTGARASSHGLTCASTRWRRWTAPIGFSP